MDKKKILKFFVALLMVMPQMLHAKGVVYEMVVAQDGSGDYTTIQDAINATKSFPDKRITIHIKNGAYHEKVRVYSWNTLLTLKGESAEGTIISYGDHFESINKGRNSTFMTYTLKVEANDFVAENLTVVNSAGPLGQAVALHVEGDRCQFVNCRIKGHQDSLYVAGEGRRHYFANCYIEGTTDFIFGESTAVFQKCEIHNLNNSYITAASTPQGIPFGLVFLQCKLTAEKEVDQASLGRPWRDYAKVVYINCHMDSHIKAQGWDNWGKTNRDKTAFYAEYGNTGDGAKLADRLPWVKRLTKKQAAKYTLANIFKGANSLPSGIGNWTPAPVAD